MILVTGGEGFVGSHLIENLNDAVPLDDRSFNKHKFNNTIVADVVSKDIWDIIKKSDLVVHAACRDIRNSIIEPMKDAEVNILGTLNVLRACREFNKPVLYISSVSIHSEASHYALSKAAGERYALFYRQWIKTSVVRLSNVFGPRDAASVIGKWMRNDKITLIEGYQTRDFTYIKDTLNGIKTAIERMPQVIVDIGTGIQTPLKELAEWMSERLNKEIEYIPEREIDNVKKRVVNIEKMRTYLGIKPEWNLYDALEEYIASGQI
jgi:UDP-glucose 4-epimerase